jgi:hypothetical protein
MVQITEEERNNALATIEYSCGCIYMFDHHIELKHYAQNMNLSQLLMAKIITLPSLFTYNIIATVY